MVGMSGVRVFSHFYPPFPFSFQFWTIFVEMTSCFAVRALGVLISVDAIRQQVAITCRSRGHCGHW